MSAEPIQSLRKTSIDVESLLPTYEHHQSTGVENEISPPEETATADDLRVFLTQLLISERGLTPDHAHDIASRWKTGNGKELRTYPATMYLDIFGREDGWVVYRETKLCLAQDKKDKGDTAPLPFWHRCKCIFRQDTTGERAHSPTSEHQAHTIAGILMAIYLVALVGVVYGIFWGVLENNGAVAVGSLFVFGGMLFVTGTCAGTFNSSTTGYTEAAIEHELQECFKRCGTHRSHGMYD